MSREFEENEMQIETKVRLHFYLEKDKLVIRTIRL